MGCHEIDDLLPGAVLGAATPGELGEVERHLATCSNHPHWADYLRVAEVLPMSLDPVTPGADVKQRLMARVYRDLDSGLARRVVWRRASGWLAAAVLAAVALTVGVRDQLSSRQLASAPVQWQVQPAAAGVQANGTLVWLPSQRTATLTLRQLPPLQPSKVYEVWLIKDGEPAPAGVFQPAGDGSASVILSGEPQSFDTVAVTPEPGPAGSTAPTSQPFMSGSLK